MAVRLEFISLIITINKINECYPGGFAAYKSENINLFGGRLWHDEWLFRDGAMNPADIENLVNFWAAKGLVPFEDQSGGKAWKDIAVVDMFRGPTLPCDWIEYDDAERCVYLKGTEKGNIIGREEMK